MIRKLASFIILNSYQSIMLHFDALMNYRIIFKSVVSINDKSYSHDKRSIFLSVKLLSTIERIYLIKRTLKICWCSFFSDLRRKKRRRREKNISHQPENFLTSLSIFVALWHTHVILNYDRISMTVLTY